MPITLTQNRPLGQVPLSAPITQVPAMDPKALNSVQPKETAAAMAPLVQALMKQKLNNTLQGRLPGTNPAALGVGTGSADAATGPQAQPLNLGGTPTGPMNA